MVRVLLVSHLFVLIIVQGVLEVGVLGRVEERVSFPFTLDDGLVVVGVVVGPHTGLRPGVQTVPSSLKLVHFAQLGAAGNVHVSDGVDKPKGLLGLGGVSPEVLDAGQVPLVHDGHQVLTLWLMLPPTFHVVENVLEEAHVLLVDHDVLLEGVPAAEVVDQDPHVLVIQVLGHLLETPDIDHLEKVTDLHRLVVPLRPEESPELGDQVHPPLVGKGAERVLVEDSPHEVHRQPLVVCRLHRLEHLEPGVEGRGPALAMYLIAQVVHVGPGVELQERSEPPRGAFELQVLRQVSTGARVDVEMRLAGLT